MQRFRDGFSAIPPMRTLGERGIATSRRRHRRRRVSDARSPTSCVEHGVDFSFTPVLDVDHGASAVIGDRAFHRNPNAIAHLASALLRRTARRRNGSGRQALSGTRPRRRRLAYGLCRSTSGRSRRSSSTISCRSARSIDRGLEAIMPAHVVYPAVDDAAGRLLAQVASGNPARTLALRRPHLFRRPRHGGRARCGRSRCTCRSVGRGRMRHGARVQRLRGSGFAARDVDTTFESRSRATCRQDGSAHQTVIVLMRRQWPPRNVRASGPSAELSRVQDRHQATHCAGRRSPSLTTTRGIEILPKVPLDFQSP